MQKSKSGLFLIELIVVILFFSLASTVCIQLFVKAHVLSSDTMIMNKSVEICQNYAECFYGVDGDNNSFIALFPELTKVSDQTFEAYYDEDVKPATPTQDTSYKAILVFTQEDNMRTLKIQLMDCSDSSEVYSLLVKKYLNAEVANESK